MTRDNRYEAAFESYLRTLGVGVVVVDEAKRTFLGPADVKSPDIVVVGPGNIRLVVDVKGRKFPGGSAGKPRKVWQNWATEEDVIGLIRWSAAFGPNYRGMFVFAYRIVPPFTMPPGTADVFEFEGQTYLFRGIDVNSYRRAMKPRSRKWGTVALPVAAFRTLVQPFSDFLVPTPAKSPALS